MEDFLGQPVESKTSNKIYEKWEEDSAKICEGDLGKTSSEIAKLHLKYHMPLTNLERKRKKLEFSYNKILEFKSRYYSGTLTPEELKNAGYRPFPEKVLKKDLEKYLNADKELEKHSMELYDYDQSIDLLKEILKIIHQLSFQLKNAIEFRKFESGVV